MFGPGYSAILPGLVGREDLPGAISLNAAQMNASRVIGPAIGGVAFHFVGPSWVFAGNAVTYLFVIGALLMVTLPATATGPRQASRWKELTAGIAAARSDPVVGRCLVTVFTFSLFALAFIGQMPTVAAHNLGIDPRSADYGILYATFGNGALLGAISIGTFLSRVSKPLIVRVGLLGYAACLAAFALLRSPVPAYPVIALVGAFYFAFITALNTTLQAEVDEVVRGRVMALWIMGFGGTVGLGNLFIGPVVAAVGITDVLLFGASVALLLAWYADVRPRSSVPRSTFSAVESKSERRECRVGSRPEPKERSWQYRSSGRASGRTGTLSLKTAFEQLLGQPCYHMLEVFGHPEHVAFWREAAEGGKVDWTGTLSDYGATSDFPACLFWQEILDANPDAVVVLSTREGQSVMVGERESDHLRHRRSTSTSGDGRVVRDVEGGGDGPLHSRLDRRGGVAKPPTIATTPRCGRRFPPIDSSTGNPATAGARSASPLGCRCPPNPSPT